jgi:hypothetical protein
VATDHDAVTDVPEPGHTNDISSITVASALSAGPPLPLSDQPAGSDAIASWNRAALNEHRIRLPPDLTGDSKASSNVSSVLA